MLDTDFGIPIDRSLQALLLAAESTQAKKSYARDPRLLLLDNLVKHRDIDPTLKHQSISGISIVITQLEGPPQSDNYPAVASVGMANLDVLYVGYAEARRRGAFEVSPRDAMIGLLLAEPAPLDELIKRLRLDVPTIVEGLRNPVQVSRFSPSMRI